MNLEQFLERLEEMDPDAVCDMLEIDSKDLVKHFLNRAKAYYFTNEADDEQEKGLDD